VLLKDRSAPVSVHVGKNQSEIDHAALAATIGRIEGRTYEKILARQIDGDESWYDFQNHGSGVRSAILANYEPIRVIRHVNGIATWWPPHLVSDIVVLAPKTVVTSLPGGH
jgi:hypothetical protein